MRTKTCLMFCMASEKAPFRNLLREGNAQVTARSESEILPGCAGRMRKLAGSKASRNTCEVSETIARMLLGVNSFLSLSKDNAPVGAPAAKIGSNCDCRAEPISTECVNPKRRKGYGVGSGVGVGVGVGVGAGAT